jgi:VWFA-related protein
MVRPSRLRSIQVMTIMVVVGCVAVPMVTRVRAAESPATTQVSPREPASSQQPLAPEVTTIRAYSNLVVIDVVVNDAQGNPVHGLQASDFTLLENNKLQTVRHFEEHSALPASEAAAPVPSASVPGPSVKLPPGLFTNKTEAPANGPVNVLLLAYLNTPLESQPFARKQLLEFLEKTPAGTRIAIFSLNAQLSMLHGFTTDLAELKAALASKKGAPGVSDILLDPVHGGPMKDRSLDVLKEGASKQQIDDINRMEAQQTSFTQELRAKLTLNGFNMLARYLVGIPGRKNVIWFSGGFPLNVEPSAAEADPNDSVVRNDEEVRKTDNLLTRAQIAVYPVDARGVQGDPALDFGSKVGDQRAAAAIELATTPPGDPRIDDLEATQEETSVGNLLQDKAQEHESMLAMAEDTGGEAFVNTNGLAQAVSKAIEHGSNYYTLTYSPTNTQWDARFRSVKVKVNQSGMKLTYRNGYYAVDPNDRNQLNAQGAATALAETNTTSAAMIHGGPEAAEIVFKVRILPANTPAQDALPSSNQANSKVKVEGPYRQYSVDLVPDAKSVNCREQADGKRLRGLEMWTFVYNTEGVRLIAASNRIRTILSAADYAKLLAGGLAFHQQISVPAKGEYYVRTAIHDLVSDKVGVVEVPVDAVATLDPLKQVAATAAPLPAEPGAGASGQAGEPKH